MNTPKPKKPRNPLVMSMTVDTLDRVCAALVVLQHQEYVAQGMRADQAFGISLILEGAIDALEYESAKVGKARRETS